MKRHQSGRHARTAGVDAERVFAVARSAYAAEYLHSLHDWRLWGAQAAVVLIAGLKMASVLLAVALFTTFLGVARPGHLLIGILGMAYWVVLAPRLFMRDVFRERAERAFDQVVDELLGWLRAER